MSVQNPPTLLKLARQTLLRDEALAISSLEDLPPGLFPGLFKDAFSGTHSKLMKVMVAVWPFKSLPLRALMKRQKIPHLETLQAVLDGIDMQLTGEFHPRREKLQVLYLRNEHSPFWKIWPDEEDSVSSPQTSNKKQVVKVLPRYALRQRLKVIVDLTIHSHLSVAQEDLLKWAQQRKDSIHFCCTKMKMWSQPDQVIKKILNVFDPEYITELELNTDWSMFQLARFAPYFGQMKNINQVLVAPLYKYNYPITNITRVTEAKCLIFQIQLPPAS